LNVNAGSFCLPAAIDTDISESFIYHQLQFKTDELSSLIDRRSSLWDSRFVHGFEAVIIS